eukprot:220318-Pelagomonas_calceolata.AAC.3
MPLPLLSVDLQRTHRLCVGTASLHRLVHGVQRGTRQMRVPHAPGHAHGGAAGAGGTACAQDGAG